MKIQQFPLLFQVDGLRIIEQLLCSRGSLIEDRIEAAGVLAQITSPWISDNHKINHLDNFVYNMVNALTGIFPLYNSPQGNKHFRLSGVELGILYCGCNLFLFPKVILSLRTVGANPMH